MPVSLKTAGGMLAVAALTIASLAGYHLMTVSGYDDKIDALEEENDRLRQRAADLQEMLRGEQQRVQNLSQRIDQLQAGLNGSQ